MLKTFFCRPGNKSDIADDIIKLFPQHKTYVELFTGTGAVYFKKEPSPKEILNDLDKGLMDAYRNIKKARPTQEETILLNKLKTIPQIRKFVDLDVKSPYLKLAQSTYIFCATFMNIGIGKIFKSINVLSKLKLLPEYKKRMKKTTLLSQDWAKVLKKYDSDDTLFYLDPPYEDSKKLYKNGTMDYEDMAEILKGIKGFFILSINDSPYIRKIFKGFIIKKIKIIKKYKIQDPKAVGKSSRNELLIMNYTL